MNRWRGKNQATWVGIQLTDVHPENGYHYRRVCVVDDWIAHYDKSSIFRKLSFLFLYVNNATAFTSLAYRYSCAKCVVLELY